MRNRSFSRKIFESYEPEGKETEYSRVLMNLDDVRKSFPSGTPKNILELFDTLFDEVEQQHYRNQKGGGMPSRETIKRYLKSYFTKNHDDLVEWYDCIDEICELTKSDTDYESCFGWSNVYYCFTDLDEEDYDFLVDCVIERNDINIAIEPNIDCFWNYSPSKHTEQENELVYQMLSKICGYDTVDEFKKDVDVQEYYDGDYDIGGSGNTEFWFSQYSIALMKKFIKDWKKLHKTQK